MRRRFARGRPAPRPSREWAVVRVGLLLGTAACGSRSELYAEGPDYRCGMLDATADASLDSDTHVTADATSAQGAIAIAVGWNTSCAVMASGLVECWGFGEDGELGRDPLSNSAVPAAVDGL